MYTTGILNVNVVSNQLLFGIAPNQTAVNFPAPSGDVTIKAPSVGSTLVATEGSPSDVTAQSASQAAVTLLTTASAGNYRISYYLDQNATCATPGSGQVYATFSWTDATHAHTAQTVALPFLSALSTTGGYLLGVVPIYSATSSAITYTTTYTACSTGTATYDLHASVEQVR
jgi:hypothetical protein